MLEKTRGIFLHYINYSDNSVIARVYTERFGQQSYIVNGVRSKKSGTRINIFQPLFLFFALIVMSLANAVIKARISCRAYPCLCTHT
ncbi:MAG: DNA repair protein RecO [Anaerorhabdus sp.]|uniref:DNA repair protein RecO n=1 Tax=Anaerorhabdus sp. TaxID=1872524 RepID=UPI003A868F41